MALPWTSLIAGIASPVTAMPTWRAFMPMLVPAGITPTVGLKLFRAAGGHIRTQTWFRKSREYYYPTRYIENIKAVRPGEYIPARFTSHARDALLSDPYEAKYHWKGIDANTGEETEGYFTIGSDQARPKGWYDRRAEKKKEEMEAAYEVEDMTYEMEAYIEQK